MGIGLRPPRHSGTDRRSGPEIQMRSPRFASGFRVRAWCAPRNDSAHSRKQYRRQLAAAGNRGLVGRAPRLKELHELLARGVLVPGARTLDDFEQMVGRLLAPV